MQHRYICSTCYSKALETYGTCAGCGVHRLTPGVAADGGRLCCDCAEDIGDFTCRRCGREGKRYLAGVCGHCVLADALRPTAPAPSAPNSSRCSTLCGRCPGPVPA
jgi:hypothetical protein